MNVPAFMLNDRPLPPAMMTWPYTARSRDFEPAPRYTPLTPRNSMALAGLGTTTSQTSSSIIGSATGATAGILTALAAATPAALASGIGAAVVGLIALGVAIYQMFQGCGQSCVQTSNFANQVAAKIQQAFDLYMSQPVHYASVQAAYLQLFDNSWAQLQALCQPQANPGAYGSAGQRCVSDRQAGGCTWKVAPFGWEQDDAGNWTYQAAGANGSGDVCWNWFNGMRDPVANDPTVQPDPAEAASAISAAVNSAGSSLTIGGTNYAPILLIAGAIALGVMLL